MGLGNGPETLMAETGVSVVVPIYSGEDYLEQLVEAVAAVRQNWEADSAPIRLAELILVDDASVDNSGAIADTLKETRPWVTVLHLSRNFGQHAATIAGILHSSGDWIVTLDEDLQHPPERIEQLLFEAVSGGRDVVYARPKSQAVHGKAWRDVSSRKVKRFMEWATGTPTLHLVNSFRLIRGSIGRASASVCTHNTYFDIALTWFTQRISAVHMDLHDIRFKETGKSGYNISKLIAHAQRMIFSSQLRFLSIGLWIGAALCAFAFFAGIYFFIRQLIDPETIGVRGWTSLFVMTSASAGVISLMLGICLQYLSTLVLKAHGRPTFFTIDRSKDRAIAEWLSTRAARFGDGDAE